MSTRPITDTLRHIGGGVFIDIASDKLAELDYLEKPWGIRVRNYETLTYDIGGGELTINTADLFRAWLEKHIEVPPRPGALFIPAPRAGERYISSIVMPDGRMRHSFLLPGEERKNWAAGMTWAENAGGDLPDRIEHAMLMRFMPEEFKAEPYWSCEQHAVNRLCAWCQYFENGGQNSGSKDYEFLVRAVRREFSDSVI